ncbi:hypothetical protein ES705_46094 [subsurface metagenome]
MIGNETVYNGTWEVVMHRILQSSVIYIVFLLIFIFIVPELSHAVIVSKTGGDYNRIQDALDNAVPGDTIWTAGGSGTIVWYI